MIPNEEHYVETGGNSCPFCDSDDIEGGHINTDSHGADQEVNCNACNKRWLDLYSLVGIIEIEE